MSFSAPSAINTDQPVVKFDPEREKLMKNEESAEKTDSQESVQMQEMGGGTHDWQSLSCLTDSTEHSAPINFDMSNRVSFVFFNEL